RGCPVGDCPARTPLGWTQLQTRRAAAGCRNRGNVEARVPLLLAGVPVYRGCAMAFENPSPVTASTLELRLATKMTGGVSLAIWMPVVVREINLPARASQWRGARGTFSTHSRLTNESVPWIVHSSEQLKGS